MIFGKKKIWEYIDSNNKHFIAIFEIEAGIVGIVSEGTAYIKGCEKAFDFLINYAQNTRKKIGCLLDNAKLNMIDDSTKMFFLKFHETNNFINKIVTVGDNTAIIIY